MVLTYPVELAWGSFHLPIHLVCEVLAYSLGYRLYTYLRARTPDRISDQGRQWILLVGAAAGVLLGSRALGLLEHPALLLGLAAYLLFRLLLEFVKPAALLPGG